MEVVEFSVANFQSYGQTQTVTVDPQVTLVAGRNNVGKSALLRAMRVFVEPQQGAREGFQVSFSWRLTTPELLALALAPQESAPDFETWAQERETRVLTAR